MKGTKVLLSLIACTNAQMTDGRNLVEYFGSCKGGEFGNYDVCWDNGRYFA